MRYPALKFLAALVIGVIIGFWVNVPLLIAAIPIVLGIGLMHWTKGYSLYLTVFSLALVNTNFRQPMNYRQLYNHRARFEAVVAEEPNLSGFLPRYTLKLSKIIVGGKEFRITGKVFLQNPQILDYGDLVSFDGEINPLDYPTNRYLFDFNTFYHRQGIFGTAKTENLNPVAKGKGNIVMQAVILPIRRYFFKTIDRFLPGEEGALLSGLILGEKSEISKATRQAFALTGVMHILAVSGLNVGILASVLFLLFKVIRLKPGIAIGLLGIILILYVGITQFSPSVVRAALMSFLAILGLFLERRANPLNAVFVAAIAILAVSPCALFASSFQLSFAATLGLILFYEKIYLFLGKARFPKILQKNLFAPLSVSAAAQLGATPLLLYSFHRFPLLSLFANLAIVPLVGLATPLGFLIPLFNLVSSTLANLFAQATWLVLALILKIAAFFGGLSFASMTTGRPSLPLIIFSYCMIILAFYLTKPWTKRVFVYSLLIGINFFIFTGLFPSKRLELSVLALTRGNAAFVRFPNGRNLLWNTGLGSTIVADFLRSRGLGTLDLVALPTINDYKKNDNLAEFKIQRLLLPVSDSVTIKTSKKIIIKNRLELKGLGTQTQFLNVDQSLGLRLVYKNISILLLNQWEPIIDSVTVLCLAKDKGRAATSPLKFEYLVIAEDKTILAESLAALKQFGVREIYTLERGGLSIVTDGKSVSFKH